MALLSLPQQWKALWLLAFSTTCMAQKNTCPEVCLDVIQGSRFLQVEPIITKGNVTAFYNYNKHNNLSFNGDNVVPLIPNHSHFMIHQDSSNCGLDVVVVHDSKESPSGGQVHMKFHYFNVQNAIVKDGDPSSNRYRYDSDTSSSEVFWEWGLEGDEHSAFQTDGLATEWEKTPTVGDCLEVDAKFFKGIDYWRFAHGPVDASGKVNPEDYMYLDMDLSLKVCVGTCGQPPKNVESVPAVSLSGNHKKLVIFAGPHETGGNPIIEFLSDGAQNGGAMDGWLWPTITMNGNVIQHPFEYFVKHQHNVSDRDAVIEGIHNAWNQSTHGVVIGAAEFDKIGADPDTGENGIAAIELLVQKLGIPNEDVKVALMYRSPRLDQWDAIRRHFDAETYEDFVCSGNEQAKLWEWLDTALNPFKIANDYATMGYGVDVIDYDGTTHLGLDVAHQIACRVMSQVECEGGFVKGLEGVKMSPLSQSNLSDLNVVDQHDLEEIFLSRDCYYKYFLEKRSGFRLLHHRKTWNTCLYQNSPFYQRMSDTDYLMNAIRSQMSCAVAPIDVHDFLESKVLERGINLVVIAGPRQTKDIQMMKFFTKYMSSAPGNERSPSFSGWNWPTSNSILLHGKPAFQVFDLLVTHPEDRAARGLLLDTIRRSWNELWHGVMIGSNSFERVGTNPATKFDPLAALKIVTDELRVPAKDVTVVLNYRTPRTDHWNDLIGTHFTESSYTNFLCSVSEKAKQWEFIDTIMSPLKVAAEYRKAGYRVVVIDESGVTEAKQDVAHSLACDFMAGVACDGEWIDDIDENSVGSFPPSPIEDLSRAKQLVLDEYFISRDCFYMYSLKDDDMFEILHQKTLWSTCQQPGENVQDAQQKYESLVDTDFFLDLLRSQVGCASGSASDLPTGFVSDVGDNTNMGNAVVIASVTLLGLFLVAVATVYCYRRRRRAKRANMWPKSRSTGIFVGDPKLRNLQNSGSNEIIFRRYKTGKSGSQDEDEVPPPPKSIPPLWAFAARLNRSNEESASYEDNLGDKPRRSFESIEVIEEENYTERKDMKTQLSALI
jgi:hypothetical protein